MKIVKYTIKGFFCLTKMIAVKLKQRMKCNQTGNSWRVRSVRMQYQHEQKHL